VVDATRGVDPLAQSPFSKELGIEVLEWAAGRAVIALKVTTRLTNRRGVARGGVVATVADMALSLAWRSTAPDSTPAGTLNLSVNFVAPAVGRITAEGRMVHMTSGCAFCEARILNGDGGLVATAQGVFRVRQPRKELMTTA
jgi:uncharacterized protein (TIGR00369 family)